MAIQMRMTQKSIGDRVMMGLQGNLQRLGELQRQLSSGKQISRPSDSPAGTVSALQLRAETRTASQFIRNADDGLGWLGTVETALNSSLEQVRRVRDLTLQGMSSGTGAAPSAREALAVEVDSIRESVISLANTRYLGRPVFGGTTTGLEAYSSSGVYGGDDLQVSRTVGEGTSIRVDSSGPDAFGSGEQQLFSVLTAISDRLRNEPGELGDELGRLDTAMSTLQAQLSDVGSRYNRVTQMRQNAEDRVLTLRQQLSDVEDIDLPKTITDLQMQQVAYEAALAATAKVVQPSLIDFLR